MLQQVEVVPSIVRNEVSATITASGGTVESTDPESKLFHAKIVIPPGALDKDTVISLTKIDQAVALPDDIIVGWCCY